MSFVRRLSAALVLAVAVVVLVPATAAAASTELFFAESPQDVEVAKALCLDCPVRAQCLSGALDRREPWGVWGGELFLAGVVIPRKRPRGRPSKPIEVR